MSAVKNGTSRGTPDRYTLVHLSDPHLFTLGRGEVAHLFNKRLLGLLSWHHRRAAHRSEILEALQGELKSIRPDQIVVTGDLTHLGLPGEYRQARLWLEALGSPDRVTVVPGNHDAYVPRAWERSLEKWRPFVVSDPGEAPPTDGSSEELFPSLRARGPLALIGLSSARPTLPLLASGKLGPRQLKALGSVLQRAGGAGMVRVILVHHPPLPGIENRRRHLSDARALASLLVRHGAELILHGHGHTSTLHELQTPRGAIPTVGVPSATEWGGKPDRRACYHLFRFERKGGRWRVAFSVYAYHLPEGRFSLEQETDLPLPCS